MAETKTKPTEISVEAFIAGVADPVRREDARAIIAMMERVTGEAPRMWGPSIIGYGSYETSTGTWPRGGFSPRKANLVLYVLADYAGRDALLAKLGKHKTGSACLYINKLADVDERVLRELIARAWTHMNTKYA